VPASLLLKSLGRLGGSVVGVDASPENIVVAKRHLRRDPFLVDKVDYRAVPAGSIFFFSRSRVPF